MWPIKQALDIHSDMAVRFIVCPFFVTFYVSEVLSSDANSSILCYAFFPIYNQNFLFIWTKNANIDI